MAGLDAGERARQVHVNAVDQLPVMPIRLIWSMSGTLDVNLCARLMTSTLPATGVYNCMKLGTRQHWRRVVEKDAAVSVELSGRRLPKGITRREQQNLNATVNNEYSDKDEGGVEEKRETRQHTTPGPHAVLYVNAELTAYNTNSP